MSPTQRTLKLYRDNGYYAEVVERWNQYAHIRQDFMGICDLICLKGKDTVCVQATSNSNVSARVNKLNASPNTKILKEAGWRIVVIGWGKYKYKRGGKLMLWKHKIIDLT